MRSKTKQRKRNRIARLAKYGERWGVTVDWMLRNVYFQWTNVCVPVCSVGAVQVCYSQPNPICGSVFCCAKIITLRRRELPNTLAHVVQMMPAVSVDAKMWKLNSILNFRWFFSVSRVARSILALPMCDSAGIVYLTAFRKWRKYAIATLQSDLLKLRVSILVSTHSSHLTRDGKNQFFFCSWFLLFYI